MQLPREKLLLLYENLFQLVDCGVGEWDPQTHKFSANIYWEILCGGKPPQTLDLGGLVNLLFQWQPTADRQRFIRAFEGGETCYRANGSVVDERQGFKEVSETFYFLRDNDGTPLRVLCCISDSDRFYLKEHADFSHSYDALTMLPDRNTMLASLSEIAFQPGSIFQQNALLVIDVNRFARVNNHYGYSTGDYVIQEIAQRLAVLKSSHVYVYRGESNNFTILFRNISHIDELDWLVKQVYSCFETPFVVNSEKRKLILTVSVGAATFYSDGEEPDTIISCAFAALKRAKQNANFGNNFALFNQSLLVDIQQRERIISVLEKHRENHCLKLVFQPQINIANNQLHALEALLRMDSPQTGSVLPSDFIPIAEETGLIIDVGYWVLEESCRAARRFHWQGLEFHTMAVNISLVQLMSPNFVENVKQIVTEAELDPSWLEFEITESVLMNSVEYGAHLLMELKKFGINITLDDFGLEYSSLNYIRALSIDTLKIDKVFVDTICNDPKSKSIVEMILNMARQIGMEVVAEGVETYEQLEELRRMLCPIIQGYYFCRPLPESEIIDKYKVEIPVR